MSACFTLVALFSIFIHYNKNIKVRICFAFTGKYFVTLLRKENLRKMLLLKVC